MSKAERDGYRSGYKGYDRNPYNPAVNWDNYASWRRGYERGTAESEAAERERDRLAARSAAQILDDEPALQDATRDLLKRICEKLEIE